MSRVTIQTYKSGISNEHPKILTQKTFSHRRSLRLRPSEQGTVAKDHFAILQVLSENLGSYGAVCRCCGLVHDRVSQKTGEE